MLLRGGSLTWDSCCAIDERKDHSTERPGDALNSDPQAGVCVSHMTHYCLDGDVEEEKGCEELSNPRSPEGPETELPPVEKGRHGWLPVVLFRYWSMSAQRRPRSVFVRPQSNIIILVLLHVGFFFTRKSLLSVASACTSHVHSVNMQKQTRSSMLFFSMPNRVSSSEPQNVDFPDILNRISKLH